MISIVFAFTPLENSGIYAGDVINRKHQLLVKVGSKPHLSNGVCFKFPPDSNPPNGKRPQKSPENF
jgi:hypothetical protein